MWKVWLSQKIVLSASSQKVLSLSIKKSLSSCIKYKRNTSVQFSIKSKGQMKLESKSLISKCYLFFLPKSSLIDIYIVYSIVLLFFMQIGKVLRVRKVKRNGSEFEKAPSALSTHECLVWERVGDLLSASTKDIVNHMYAKHVMSPLLGSQHVDPGVCPTFWLEFKKKNQIFISFTSVISHSL